MGSVLTAVRMQRPLLYHLGEDPGERFDVAEQYPDVLAEPVDESERILASTEVAPSVSTCAHRPNKLLRVKREDGVDAARTERRNESRERRDGQENHWHRGKRDDVATLHPEEQTPQYRR